MIYDLIIIGGGPAGITAGIYALRLGMKTLLIAKNFGGQIGAKAVDIENYPGFEKISGLELIQKMEKHLKSQKAEIKKNEVLKVSKKGKVFFVCAENKKEFQARAVILASGADPRPLGVPGEKEFIGRGVSYCSLCDGPIFKDKIVAVVGGGNVGFETALFLSNIVKKIYILEFSGQIKAFKSIQDAVKLSGKVKIITKAKIKEIKGLSVGGQGNKFVDSIVFEHNRKEKTLKVNGVFIEIGYVPAVPDLGNMVDFNKEGEVKVELETMRTKTPGFFAAGDVNAGKFKQIICSAGEGAKAALAAHNFIKLK